MLDFFRSVPAEVFDAIGVTGFGLYVLNYCLLTFEKMKADYVSYFAINWIAATCVLIGLFNAFNLASALIQIFWIAISTAGMIIRFRKHRRLGPMFETRRDY